MPISKKIAYDNYQQNVDSENLLLSLIKHDNFTKEILTKNDLNIKKIEKTPPSNKTRTTSPRNHKTPTKENQYAHMEVCVRIVIFFLKCCLQKT